MADDKTEYRDESHINVASDVDQSKVPSTIKKLATWIRQKMYGEDVRESIARGIEKSSEVAQSAVDTANASKNIADNLNQRWDDQISEKVDPDEAIDFRHSDMLQKTFDTSRKRGDFFDQDLAERGINVRWFGATGDGVTDDTNSFIAAFDYANSNLQTNTLYIPSGTYLVNPEESFIIPRNYSIVGDTRWSSIIKNQATVPVFVPSTRTKISHLAIWSNNSRATALIYIPGTTLDTVDSDCIIEDCDIRGTGDAPNYATDGIMIDLNARAFWNMRILNNEFRNVRNGIKFDIQNGGWSTGNKIQNNVIHGYSHSAIEITSSNDTMGQFSQSTFTANTAQLYHYNPDAIAYRLMGNGNEYHNLTYFKDSSDQPAGADDPYAIELRNPVNPPVASTQFNVKNTSFNRFSGGLLEGGFSDPDGVYQFQSFNDVNVHFTENGSDTILKLNSKKMSNLLLDQTIAYFYEQSWLKYARANDGSEITTGSDANGAYIEVKSGSSPTYLTYMLPTTSARNAIVGAQNYAIGFLAKVMQGDERTAGSAYMSYSATSSNTSKDAIALQNHLPNGLIEYLFNKTQNTANATKTLTDNIAVTINITADSIVRIYRIALVPTLVAQLSDISSNDNLPIIQGGYNFAVNSEGEISTTGTSVDTIYKNSAIRGTIPSGSFVTVSCDIEATNVLKSPTITASNVAYGALTVKYSDNTTTQISASLPNLDIKSFKRRVKTTGFIAEKNIVELSGGLVIRKGAIGNIRLANLQVEYGAVSQGYRPNPADKGSE